MTYNLCKSLTEEHEKFMFTHVQKVDFGNEKNLDKFKEEILVFNEFASIFSHYEFDHCKFQASKAMRDLRGIEKKLCQIADRKIERAEEIRWDKSSGSLHQASRQQFGQQYIIGAKKTFNKEFGGNRFKKF